MSALIKTALKVDSRVSLLLSTVSESQGPSPSDDNYLSSLYSSFDLLVQCASANNCRQACLREVETRASIAHGLFFRVPIPLCSANMD